MSVQTTLLTVAVTIEEDADQPRRVRGPFGAEQEVRKAVLAAVAVLFRDRPDVRVRWESMGAVPLDGNPQFGRCAVCNRWVFDADAKGPGWLGVGLSRGARVDGRLRCDEHLPPGHPLCFAGRGYDGPAPEPGAAPAD